MGISKKLLKELAEVGFFDEKKHIKEIVSKIDSKGFTLKGKQVSLLSQLLTLLCREGVLERHKDENGEWEYIKAG